MRYIINDQKYHFKSAFDTETGAYIRTGVMGNMKTAVEWYEKALEVIDDPELERKTALFKEMGKSDPHWDEDYLGDMD